jgi:uncharacterized membrane protein YkoI
MKYINTFFTLVFAMLLMGASTVYAQGNSVDNSRNNLTHKTPPGQSQSGAGISSAEAARIAGKQTGGRVLEVSPRGRGYNVKVYVQGKVRTVFVDAKR